MIQFVTGGAGFIACNLIPKLLERGHTVVALDNFIRGRRSNVAAFTGEARFTLVEVDCSDPAALTAAMARFLRPGDPAEVWHMAANSDIPAGVSDPWVDHKHTFMTTFATLLAMAELKIGRLHFASSSAIYGDFGTQRIAEDTAPYRPISNYGAMKLASEAQISAAAESFLDKADVFRFPNVVGVPATHGVILDFIEKLRATPERLDVLGNGTQQKAYLHVEDLVSAMLFIADRSSEKMGIFNIGPTDDGVTVRFIAETVRAAVSRTAEIRYGEGNRGWVGDVPRFRYAVDRLAALGWTPSLDSAAAIRRAVAEIAAESSRA